jgi:hypothetical protein
VLNEKAARKLASKEMKRIEKEKAKAAKKLMKKDEKRQRKSEERLKRKAPLIEAEPLDETHQRTSKKKKESCEAI